MEVIPAAPRMLVESLSIPEIKRIGIKVFRDQRGVFAETYSQRALAEAGIDATFVQDNHSLSLPKGVVRGLHFQKPPHAQGKLVRVLQGAIFDVAVDIREGSPTFGRHVSLELAADDWAQLWVPEGFAHGFCTLAPDTVVLQRHCLGRSRARHKLAGERGGGDPVRQRPAASAPRRPRTGVPDGRALRALRGSTWPGAPAMAHLRGTLYDRLILTGG
jgi:dTDP-4-dehydrorhamnose 3,5-epimerase